MNGIEKKVGTTKGAYDTVTHALQTGGGAPSDSVRLIQFFSHRAITHMAFAKSEVIGTKFRPACRIDEKDAIGA